MIGKVGGSSFKCHRLIKEAPISNLASSSSAFVCTEILSMGNDDLVSSEEQSG